MITVNPPSDTPLSRFSAQPASSLANVPDVGPVGKARIAYNLQRLSTARGLNNLRQQVVEEYDANLLAATGLTRQQHIDQNYGGSALAFDNAITAERLANPDASDAYLTNEQLNTLTEQRYQEDVQALTDAAQGYVFSGLPDFLDPAALVGSFGSAVVYDTEATLASVAAGGGVGVVLKRGLTSVLVGETASALAFNAVSIGQSQASRDAIGLEPMTNAEITEQILVDLGASVVFGGIGYAGGRALRNAYEDGATTPSAEPDQPIDTETLTEHIDNTVAVQSPGVPPTLDPVDLDQVLDQSSDYQRMGAVLAETNQTLHSVTPNELGLLAEQVYIHQRMRQVQAQYDKLLSYDAIPLTAIENMLDDARSYYLEVKAKQSAAEMAFEARYLKDIGAIDRRKKKRLARDGRKYQRILEDKIANTVEGRTLRTLDIEEIGAERSVNVLAERVTQAKSRDALAATLTAYQQAPAVGIVEGGALRTLAKAEATLSDLTEQHARAQIDLAHAPDDPKLMAQAQGLRVDMAQAQVRYDNAARALVEVRKSVPPDIAKAAREQADTVSAALESIQSTMTATEIAENQAALTEYFERSRPEQTGYREGLRDAAREADGASTAQAPQPDKVRAALNAELEAMDETVSIELGGVTYNKDQLTNLIAEDEAVSKAFTACALDTGGDA